jgi:hypothetical protein
MKCSNCNGEYELCGRYRRKKLCGCCNYLEVRKEEKNVFLQQSIPKKIKEIKNDTSYFHPNIKPVYWLSNCCGFPGERVDLTIDGEYTIVYLCENCWKVCKLIKEN